jgi:hypothetical protein
MSQDSIRPAREPAERSYRRWTVRAFFEPRDVWIGVYWTWAEAGPDGRDFRVYVCILPCLPILVTRHALEAGMIACRYTGRPPCPRCRQLARTESEER